MNDADCYLANFWRAISYAPQEVAKHADWPINEADLHARHTWLVNQTSFRERMKTDPDYFDAKIAGWWCWGLSMWIGSGWCSSRPGVASIKRPRLGGGAPTGVQVQRRRPHDVGASRGNGIHVKLPTLTARGNGGCVGRQIPDINGLGNKGVSSQMPDIDGADASRPQGDRLLQWFESLRVRLRQVRVCCGDWSRIMGPTPLALNSNSSPGFITGVFLDPPYDAAIRDPDLYSVDDGDISAVVRKWALEHGDNPKLRIALCGYEGEHAMPERWECVAWKANGGYGNTSGNKNSHLERIWFSPHCLKDTQRELF